MPRTDITSLPDHARLWIFAASRPLETDEQRRLLDEVDAFLDGWAAHGVPLTCARDWRYDRFLLVAVDEQAAGVSGCSIDALVRSLRTLGQQTEVDFLDNGPVLYRADGEIRRVPRGAFGELAQRGAVAADTVVFDNTVPTLGALRSGRWETAARETWHGRVFFDTATH